MIGMSNQTHWFIQCQASLTISRIGMAIKPKDSREASRSLRQLSDAAWQHVSLSLK